MGVLVTGRPVVAIGASASIAEAAQAMRDNRSSYILVEGAGETGILTDRDLRSRVFDQVATYSSQEMHRFGTASLITRSTNDVQQVQMLVFFGLNFLVQAPITGIGGVVLALRQEASLAWLIAVMVAVMLVAVGAIIGRAAPLFRRMQGQNRE